MIKRIVFIALMMYGLPTLAADAMKYVKLVDSDKGIAPALELSDVNAQAGKFDDYKEQTTVVHFWATWCAPCIKELPELQAFSGKYSRKGLHVVAVATDSHESVKEFLAEKKVDLNIMVDQYGSAMHDFKVKVLPSSYIVNKNGELQLLAQGPVDWASAETEQLIDSVIALP